MPTQSCTSTPLRNADLRILVLSPAVPQTWYAGSMMLYRLFQHHPSDRIKAVGPKPQPRSQVLSCEYVELLPAASSRLDLTRLAQMKRSLEALSLLGRIPDDRVDAAVGDFQADVVITVMERLDYVDAAHRFCQRRGVPLALIVHDRLESFDRVYGAFAGAQRSRLAGIYRDASARFCVSPEMERCLARIYGAPGTVLYPSRPDSLTPRVVDESARLKNPPRLTMAYTGAESYGYGARIREVMPALADLVTLRIYSRDAWPSPPQGAVYAGAPAPDELWPRVMAECDAVWLPYSHGVEMRSLYETHFPSKLTEYTALGMPVLISGPSYATGVRWGERAGDATITLADDTIDAIRGACSRLTGDPALRTSLARGALVAGARDFDPSHIRDTLYEQLHRAAEGRAA